MVDVHNQCNAIVYYQCYARQQRNIIPFNAPEHADINASQESVGVKFYSKLSNRKWVSTMCNVGNLWILEASLSKLEKFQHSLAVPDIKYNFIINL